jgi:hypothetical protein
MMVPICRRSGLFVAILAPVWFMMNNRPNMTANSNTSSAQSYHRLAPATLTRTRIGTGAGARRAVYPPVGRSVAFERLSWAGCVVDFWATDGPSKLKLRC